MKLSTLLLITPLALAIPFTPIPAQLHDDPDSDALAQSQDQSQSHAQPQAQDPGEAIKNHVLQNMRPQTQTQPQTHQAHAAQTNTRTSTSTSAGTRTKAATPEHTTTGTTTTTTSPDNIDPSPEDDKNKPTDKPNPTTTDKSNPNPKDSDSDPPSGLSSAISLIPNPNATQNPGTTQTCPTGRPSKQCCQSIEAVADSVLQPLGQLVPYLSGVDVSSLLALECTGMENTDPNANCFNSVMCCEGTPGKSASQQTLQTACATWDQAMADKADDDAADAAAAAAAAADAEAEAQRQAASSSSSVASPSAAASPSSSPTPSPSRAGAKPSATPVKRGLPALPDLGLGQGLGKLLESGAGVFGGKGSVIGLGGAGPN